METVLYELKPYYCMAIGAISVHHGGWVFTIAGLTLFLCGLRIHKMRKNYRKKHNYIL